MPLTTETVPLETEAQRIEGWRLHVLVEAGYPVALAERLAPRFDIDLHRAVELIAAGCNHATATDILL
jgi:hypothetical protein